MSDRYTVGGTLLGVLAAATLAKYGCLYLIKRQRDRQFVRVGKVAEINIYPVKSCAGLSVETAECDATGLHVGDIADRHWMVVRGTTFITQRQDSRLSLIQTRSDNGQLVLSAPGMPDLKLPTEADKQQKFIKCRIFADKVNAQDCGYQATSWIRSYLGGDDLSMVQYIPGVTHRDLIHTDLQPWTEKALPDDEIAFSDAAGFMLLARESLTALNEHLKTPVTMRNFRPNFVVVGSEAFAEDDWEEVRIGKTTFRFMSLCPRCLLTTVNPEQGVRNRSGDPLKTLKEFRITKESERIYGASPLFGIYLAVNGKGVVNVGDEIYAIKRVHMNDK